MLDLRLPLLSQSNTLFMSSRLIVLQLTSIMHKQLEAMQLQAVDV